MIPVNTDNANYLYLQPPPDTSHLRWFHTNSYSDGRCSAFTCADILGLTLPNMVIQHKLFVDSRVDWWQLNRHCPDNAPDYVLFHAEDCNGRSDLITPPQLRARWELQNSDRVTTLQTIHQDLVTLMTTKLWRQSTVAKGSESFGDFISYVFNDRGIPDVLAYNIDLPAIPPAPFFTHTYVNTMVCNNNIIRTTDSRRFTSFSEGKAVFFINTGNHWHSLVSNVLLGTKSPGLATKVAKASR